MIKTTLMETLQESQTNKGIFTTIAELNKLQWLTLEEAKILDTQYYYGHSGAKYITPLFNNLINKDGVDAALTLLANNILLMFSDKWNSIYDALHKEYDMLNNYGVNEVETPNITRESNSRENSKITTTRNSSDSASTSGFNSPDFVPTDSNSAESTENVSADENDNYTSSSVTETGTREYTKSGIIGSSNQKLIKEELDLRKYLFYADMYKDVDSLLVLRVY